MTKHIDLNAEREEFATILDLIARWGDRAEGIGDDAAVARLPRGDALVASVDTAIEGRHFQRDWLSPREIGYRAVAAALSDLAAMAATPFGVLIALAVPASWRDDLPEIADGIGDAVDGVRAKILGGNLSDAGELGITTTVLGSSFAPLTRAGARVGERVYVTGRLGGVALATQALLAGRGPSNGERERFAHPMPRVSEARWLADRGATAGIDLSDGLAADVAHVAAASGVGLEIDVERIPCFDGASPAIALGSGEEYELVVTMAGDADTTAFERVFGVPLTMIGRVVAGAGVALLAGGQRVASPPGHDHFS